MRRMVEKRRGSWGVGLLGRRKNRDSVSITGPYSTRSLARITHAHLNMMLCEMGRHRLTHQRVSSSEIHATLHSNSLSPSTLSTLLNLSQPASCAHRLVSPWGGSSVRLYSRPESPPNPHLAHNATRHQPAYTFHRPLPLLIPPLPRLLSNFPPLASLPPHLPCIETVGRSN